MVVVVLFDLLLVNFLLLVVSIIIVTFLGTAYSTSVPMPVSPATPIAFAMPLGSARTGSFTRILLLCVLLLPNQ